MEEIKSKKASPRKALKEDESEITKRVIDCNCACSGADADADGAADLSMDDGEPSCGCGCGSDSNMDSVLDYMWGGE